MVKAVVVFRGKHNLVEDDALSAMHRVPNAYTHWKCSVRRFVCGYIPKLAGWLWETKKEQADRRAKILLAMRGLKVTSKDYKAVAESAERYKSMQKYKRHRQSVALSQRAWEANRRSGQWNVCK
ncbi:MAG: hypothetical protein IPN69_08605 [Acidobacteria bacterium]|nr:hypothetical protein [Acidobacteriota bacterium]